VKRLIVVFLIAILISGCDKQRQSGIKSDTVVNAIGKEVSLEPTPTPSPTPSSPPSLQFVPTKATGGLFFDIVRAYPWKVGGVLLALGGIFLAGDWVHSNWYRIRESIRLFQQMRINNLNVNQMPVVRRTAPADEVNFMIGQLRGLEDRLNSRLQTLGTELLRLDDMIARLGNDVARLHVALDAAARIVQFICVAEVNTMRLTGEMADRLNDMTQLLVALGEHILPQDEEPAQPAPAQRGGRGSRVRGGRGVRGVGGNFTLD
jgi:hypothetical protein